MVYRDKITDFLNKFLRIDEIKDSSLNGLQVEGCKNVKKIVFGVSASLELIKKAAGLKADMIIVHHGLLWDKPNIIKNRFKRKIYTLLKNDISLLGYHLPLDMHSSVGNNIQIIKYFNVRKIERFGKYSEEMIGYKGILPTPVTTEKICAVLKKKLNSDPICIKFGPAKIKTLGIISGGADGMIMQAVDAKLDLYITGNIDEPIQEICRETGINYISAGHYNSEKAGVLALSSMIKKKFNVETEFVDIPNPF